MSRNTLILAVCLVGIILSLLLVGVVSTTLLRHVFQITPVVAALVAVARRAKWGKYAAIPILIFWFIIMLFIWLYLLGIARIVSGRFTPVEIVSTVMVGLCCLCGVVSSLRIPTVASRTLRILVFVIFAVLQVGAMRLSLSPFVSHH